MLMRKEHLFIKKIHFAVGYTDLLQVPLPEWSCDGRKQSIIL
jgi:hypothetical protein